MKEFRSKPQANIDLGLLLSIVVIILRPDKNNESGKKKKLTLLIFESAQFLPNRL